MVKKPEKEKKHPKIVTEQDLKKVSPELTVLSFGAGQDSTTILYKLVFDPIFKATYAPKRLLVLMADTGDEHPATYQHVEFIKAFCLKHGIEFVMISKDMGYHNDGWGSLREQYAKNHTCGSKGFNKSCTDNLKIKPLYSYLNWWVAKNYGIAMGYDKSDMASTNDTGKLALVRFAEKYGKINMLIGLAAGEESRIADPDYDSKGDGRRWRAKSVRIIYPLMHCQMDRKACQDYIKQIGQPMPIPSNCLLCPWMSDIELLWLYRFMPDDFAAWCKFEKDKLEKSWYMDHAPFFKKEKGKETPKAKFNLDTGKWDLPRDAKGKKIKPIKWGNRNIGVFGDEEEYLPEKIKSVIAKFGHMTDKELNEYKMSHGHCVKSKY